MGTCFTSLLSFFTRTNCEQSFTTTPSPRARSNFVRGSLRGSWHTEEEEDTGLGMARIIKRAAGRSVVPKNFRWKAIPSIAEGTPTVSRSHEPRFHAISACRPNKDGHLFFRGRGEPSANVVAGHVAAETRVVSLLYVEGLTVRRCTSWLRFYVAVVNEISMSLESLLTLIVTV